MHERLRVQTRWWQAVIAASLGAGGCCGPSTASEAAVERAVDDLKCSSARVTNISTRPDATYVSVEGCGRTAGYACYTEGPRRTGACADDGTPAGTSGTSSCPDLAVCGESWTCRGGP